MPKQTITAAQIDEFLERAQDLSHEAADIANALAKQIELDGPRRCARVSSAIHVAERFTDLAGKLATIARHAEDIEDLRRDLTASVSA